MIVGYARVSTDGQTLDSQLAALRQAGAERVFSEKISGAVTDRKALGRAIEALGTETFSWSRGLIGWQDQPVTF
jgi:DNA invertase Pin-like site-specific DNA recombinase